MLTDLSELEQQVIRILIVTEDLFLAEDFLKNFLRVTQGIDRNKFLEELSAFDPRFLGWDCEYKYSYQSKNISGDALNLSREVARILKSGDFDIKLIAIRRGNYD